MPRVLIADDSPTMRALISEVLASLPDLEVIGQARNGLEAVEMTVRLRPDVVTMDVEMPIMTGYQATKEIMIRNPTPVVILSSYVDDDEIERCTEAFRSGALATFRKLPDVTATDFDERAWELCYTVNQLGFVKVSRHWRIAAEGGERRQTGDDRIRVVATVVSAKGSATLGKILGRLPPDFAAPVLVVPRLGHGFQDGFINWLSRSCKLDVKVPRGGEPLAPATVYVAPEDLHLTVGGDYEQAWADLSRDPPLRGFRPSATTLFDSVAATFGSSALALILPGVGEDGIPGLCSIRIEGGRIIAHEQVQRSGFRKTGIDVATGLADITLPLEPMAAQLMDVHYGLLQRRGLALQR